MLRYILLLGLALTLFQCSIPSRANSRSLFKELKEFRNIRVMLSDNLQIREMHFPFDVSLRANNHNFETLSKGETISFIPKANQIEVHINESRYLLDYIDISPAQTKDLLSFNALTYRGIFRLRARSNKLLLLNALSIEDYLKAVIFSEMGPASGINDFDALKAFAVCMRNYTYMKLKEGNDLFDIYADIRDQVYSGVKSERTYTNRAVEETSNLVLLFNDQLAKTFYFSSCGGFTENSDNVFAEKNISYLSGVKCGEEAYCSISPGFQWEEEYSSEDLVKFLKDSKYLDNLAYKVNDIEIRSRYNSGRVKELKVTVENSDGDRKGLFLIGNSIRTIIKSKAKRGILRSTFFEIDPVFKDERLSTLRILGKGNGHGVGFCQWGAIGQSRLGKKFDEILSFYFPGTSLGEVN